MSLIRLRSREQARIKPSLIRNRVYGFLYNRSQNDTGLDHSVPVQVSFVSVYIHDVPEYDLDWVSREKNRSPRGITAE